jgi:hypothetical protein
MADKNDSVESGKKPYNSPEVSDELTEHEAEQVTGGAHPIGGPSPGAGGPSPGGPSPG